MEEVVFVQYRMLYLGAEGLVSFCLVLPGKDYTRRTCISNANSVCKITDGNTFMYGFYNSFTTA